MPSVYSASDLGVRLDGHAILSGLSFEVEAGRWVGLVGPNGAGKTTLLRTLAGLLPFSGRLTLGGTPMAAWRPRERARAVAFVRQQTSLGVDFTVREVVALGRAPHLGWVGALGPADRAAVRRALDAVDLVPLAGRAVPTLSGGERQRTFLAQALAQDAPTLLLDEPTAHLDVRHQLDGLARSRILADEGRTVVAAVHDLELAARFADRLLVLDRGRLVADGRPHAVLTPGLLRRVFRVEADVTPEPVGVRIRYHAPLPSLDAPLS